MSSVSDKIRQKSAAEFFCEHQQIAGFDNPGKSLFTSIRELVENSLDATEIIHKLPNINVKIIEYNEQEHNKLHGIKQKEKKVEEVISTAMDLSVDGGIDSNEVADSAVAIDTAEGTSSTSAATPIAAAASCIPAKTSKKDKPVKDTTRMYYKIVVEDNGCGMASKDIGNLLGRVLSGSKHGIKQTRGKFGLGAKMALIWSKKSSGLPIEITSAQYTVGRVHAPEITSMVLDMDIYKNEPKVISTKCLPNPQSWHGTVISVTVSGAWTYYKARILQYFQQLAVITPYANIEFDFQCISNSKKDFHLSFTRRSEQMPTTAREILPHPDSLNHITLNKLLMDSPHTNHSNGLYKFLTTELAGISPSVALKIIQNLIVNTASNSSELETLKVTNNTHIKPNSLSGKHITALSQILRDERQIKPPTHIMPTANNYSSNSCLSPVGEYNLRLGIIKELRPKLIATYSDVNSNNQHSHYEGHPFVIEAAVALGSHAGSHVVGSGEDENVTKGGKAAASAASSSVSSPSSNKTDNDTDGSLNTKDQQSGIHIYRFANRIPLLFETGADVVTQVATKQVNWGSYLIDPKKDHIGVFISIVSTKIPYKGTSKEYIGADITEISKAVKAAIQQCGLQLKIQLNLSLKAKHDYERKRTLSKYIPNICNALYGILTLMKEDEDKKIAYAAEAATSVTGDNTAEGSSATAAGTPSKRGSKRGQQQALLAHTESTVAGAAANSFSAISAISAGSATADTSGTSGVVSFQDMQQALKKTKRDHLLKQFANGLVTVDSLTNNLNNGVCKYDNDLQNAEAGGLGSKGSKSKGTSSSGTLDEHDGEDQEEGDSDVLESNMSLNMLLSNDNISKLSSVSVMNTLFVGVDAPYHLPASTSVGHRTASNSHKEQQSQQENSVREIDLTLDDNDDDHAMQLSITSSPQPQPQTTAATDAAWECLQTKSADGTIDVDKRVLVRMLV